MFSKILMGYNIIFILLLVHQYNAKVVVHHNTKAIKAKKQLDNCDIFNGSWEYNDNYTPYYNTSSCPFISVEFDCQKNGRPDQLYLKYRWKPTNCVLPSFDGEDMLGRYQGKKIMFVGDSLSLQQWQSLTCMLHASVPHSTYTFSNKAGIATFYIQDYDISVMLYPTPYLVDVVSEKMGRIVKLDSIIQGGNVWKHMDLLVFSCWHGWDNTPGWDYIQMGDKLYKNMVRLEAYKYGLTTWSNWVKNNINNKKTQVFFQNISPTHDRSQDWNETTITTGTCKGETTPTSGTTYPTELPRATQVLKQVLSELSSKVTLLDITVLS
ncbi:hypothetical protein RND81_12G218500 [Saponaria officinalis]|uniref:Trichome birefringence-like N-terminal domain-containing protein n=1 Tax=Saponaria officinalis TaxID=3572 RepID=A0AAW1HDW5_SAPOF